MKIQWHYLLLPTIHELNVKNQLNNSFESILDEDVPYSIVLENITAEETRDMFKAFAMLLCIFFFFTYFYIFNLEYPKKLEATFLLVQKLSFEFQIGVKCHPKYK